MSAQDTIKDTVNANDVVLFMKGTKMMHNAGFLRVWRGCLIIWASSSLM